jgi:hypothetical protein
MEVTWTPDVNDTAIQNHHCPNREGSTVFHRMHTGPLADFSSTIVVSLA